MTMTLAPTATALTPAKTLNEAETALVPEPLAFEGAQAATALYYTPHPSRIADGLAEPPPSELLGRRLLESTSAMKQFLSGHVGGGKTTELHQLAANADIKAAFFPIYLDIELAYAATLDIAQLLFFIASALYSYGQKNDLLGNRDLWEKPFRELDAELFGKQELTTTEGTIETKLNLVFFELKQSLKVEQNRLRQFRDIAENKLTILLDLIAGLNADLRATSHALGKGKEPLVIVDGLDKVRGESAQRQTFREKPSVLLEPPLRIIYTIPTGVALDQCPSVIRPWLLHLYPAPILKKARTSYNPEEAVNDLGLDFMERVLNSRVAPGIFKPEAVRLAAIYSGGVLRTFFWLLRSSIETAKTNKLNVVDARVMRRAIKTVRLNESMSLHQKEYEQLAKVHHTNQLPHGAGIYLDESWVLECVNDKVWYEANPLFWTLLDPNSQ